VVYAWLLARCADTEAREQMVQSIYAPPGGWDAAEKGMFAAIMAAGGDSEGGG
jgi:hypothetical protein